MNEKKSIGVMTSGGDAPGMNAALRAVVRKGIREGYTVYGIKKGYNGLLSEDYEELTLRSVSDIIQRGGTILGTARCKEFSDDAGVEKGKEMCKKIGIEGLVVIGGDGSFRGALDLSRKGINCIGIPGTIDNDISCTDYTIGFDTAMNTVVELVDKIRDTSQAHSRISVVEVMGRHAGHIALSAGIACGAASIIIEEKPFDLNEIANKINNSIDLGKEHFIIMVSEGVGNSEKIAAVLQDKTGLDARATILGHVQRGGSPTLRDRVIASQMGCRAVELLTLGEKSKVVAYKNGRVIDYTIEEALSMKKTIKRDLYKISNEISF